MSNITLSSEDKNDIIEILSEQIDVESSRIYDYANFRTELGVKFYDSMEISIIVALENQFDVNIEIKDFDGINTAEQIYKLITQKINE